MDPSQKMLSFSRFLVVLQIKDTERIEEEKLTSKRPSIRSIKRDSKKKESIPSS